MDEHNDSDPPVEPADTDGEPIDADLALVLRFVSQQLSDEQRADFLNRVQGDAALSASMAEVQALEDTLAECEPVGPSRGAVLRCDIVGAVCESGDFLAKDRSFPSVEAGDLLAVRSAGAYGFSMASNYNARPRAAEVLVRGEHFAVVRERESLEDLVRGESIPEDLLE